MICILLSGFFSSIEFYVIMAIVAAAIVAFAARPQTRGEVHEYLLGSTLSTVTSQMHGSDEPSLEFKCVDDGRVLLYRRGLEPLTMSGAVSIAAKFDGVDLSMEERLTDGSPYDLPVAEAQFVIDFLPPGRYHVTYNSQKTGLFLSMSLHVSPGIVATRILNR